MIIVIVGLSCSNSDNHKRNKSCNETSKNIELVPGDKNTKVGADLFKAILDTITLKHLDLNLLINNDWQFKVSEDCVYKLIFKHNSIGESYNCEVDETNEISFKIAKDTLLVKEYEFSETDSLNKRMTRNDKYIFNGSSLIMIASVTYYGGDKPRVPKIKEIIEYKMTNKH